MVFFWNLLVFGIGKGLVFGLDILNKYLYKIWKLS